MGRLIKPRLNQDSSRTRRSRSPSPHVYWASQTNFLRPHSQRPPIKAKGEKGMGSNKVRAIATYVSLYIFVEIRAPKVPPPPLSVRLSREDAKV